MTRWAVRLLEVMVEMHLKETENPLLELAAGVEAPQGPQAVRVQNTIQEEAGELVLCLYAFIIRRIYGIHNYPKRNYF